MDSERHWINRAHSINSADMIYVPMRVDDIPGNKLQLLNCIKDLPWLVTWIYDSRFTCFWAGI
ncbi:hypothetical protein KDH_52750 [Dictyobacter sp. S3.2.2.5]|uniref:Uncharacterized protein n=1 Tax=Dictyobacter halimunensis TaxID=3026934 RepID=A0ABQ6G046_9CHLR|nr:hypothetical protein KDH_52750 [Dictyobacter sp. S3.2.2.5]